MAKKKISNFDLEPVKKNTHLIVIDSDIGSSKFTTKRMTLDIAQRVIVATKTVAYSIVDTDEVILVDATIGGTIINLLTAVGRTGKKHTVKKIDVSANTVTITPNGAETIDGAPFIIHTTQFDTVTFISDGVNWLVI